MRQIFNSLPILINPKLLLKHVLFWIVLIGLWGVIIYSTIQLIDQWKNLSTLTTSLNSLKDKATLYGESSALTNQEVTEFNSTAARLVPEQENYFSLISSLEELTRQTGFLFSDYSIDLSNTDSEKLSLSVKGSGDINSFIQFLKDYNFSSGRLITIESIEFNQQIQNDYYLQLNFYHKKIEKESSQNITSLLESTFIPEIHGASEKINKEDVKFIKRILSETSTLRK